MSQNKVRPGPSSPGPSTLRGRYYDLIERCYVFLRRWLNTFLQLLNDLHTLLHEWIGLALGRVVIAFSTTFGLIVSPSTLKNPAARFLFNLLRLLLGIPFLLLSFLAFSLVTLAGGTIAGVLGLRNLGEYSFKEQLAAWIVAAALLLALPKLVASYILYKVSLCCIFAIILIGLNFLYGQCGIVTLGHAAFVLVGAYLTTLLRNGALGLPLPLAVAILLASAFTGGLGFILGAPSLRIKDQYLMIVTLAFTIAIPQIIKSRYLAGLSGGSQEGIEIRKMLPPGWLAGLAQETWNYYFIMAFFACLVGFAYNIQVNSQVGRAFRILKCDDVIARAQGINVPKYKLLAFVFSAFYAGCAGGLMMAVNPYISSESYTAFDSIDYFIGLIIGGPGTLLGSIIGGSFLAFEGDLIKAVAKLMYGGQSFMRMVYGAILIVMICFFPEGLAGLIRNFMKRRFVPKLRRGTYFMRPPSDYDFLAAKDYRDIEGGKP